MLGYVSFMPNVLGPVMPFLRDELHLSYTQGGLLFSAIACGMIVSGLTADRVVDRRGRRFALWTGAAVSTAGVACLALNRHPTLGIAAGLFMGLGSSLSVVIVQAVLSDKYGSERATALTEANVAASASPVLAPLLVGAFQRLGVGWRGVLLLPAIILGLIAAQFRNTRIPRAQRSIIEGKKVGERSLPAGFWAYWIVIFLSVSIEWCLIVWGADYLEQGIGLRKVNAATAMSVFLLAMLIGRIAGSRLTHILRPASILLLAFGIGLAGFLFFWRAGIPIVNLAGLFLAGLGVANLFPLAMALAIGTAPGQSDIASARVFLGTGAAILLAPILLGWAADRIAIQNALGMVALMLVVAFAVSLTSSDLGFRRS
jgi:fucose permease